MNAPSRTASELEYLLERYPTAEEIAECDEWLEFNPGYDLSEWVSAMREIGGV